MQRKDESAVKTGTARLTFDLVRPGGVFFPPGTRIIKAEELWLGEMSVSP